jgi:cytoskeletal protein CcmA (bactofilin family)
MNLRGKGHTGELNGILDRGSHLRGELHFEQTFRVDGKLTGKVISDGDLVIGERGEIEGEIEVGRAFVSGIVRGHIRTARRLEICAGGRVFADVETPALVIGEGALFEGNCAMERSAPAGETAADGPRAALPRLAAVKDH